MKLKRIIIIFTVFWLLMTTSTTSKVYADSPGGFLIRNYTIDLIVDCIEGAFADLGVMPGIVLESSMYVQSGWGRMERRVNNRDINFVLEDLNYLGRVSGSSTRTRNVFSDFMDLRSELQVRDSEYIRLVELLREVATLNDFTVVENRLRVVISERERIQGNLNYFEFETSTSLISITLFEDNEWAEEPVGAFSRIGRAFINSASATLAVIQGILIALVYVSIPLTIIAIIAFCIWRIMPGRFENWKLKIKADKKAIKSKSLKKEENNGITSDFQKENEDSENDFQKKQEGEKENVKNEPENKTGNEK